MRCISQGNRCAPRITSDVTSTRIRRRLLPLARVSRLGLLLLLGLAPDGSLAAASPARVTTTEQEGEGPGAFGRESLAHAEIVEEMEIVTHAEDAAALGVRDTYDKFSLPHGHAVRVSRAPYNHCLLLLCAVSVRRLLEERAEIIDCCFGVGALHFIACRWRYSSKRCLLSLYQVYRTVPVAFFCVDSTSTRAYVRRTRGTTKASIEKY